jgi:hypothetical protein
LLDVRNCIAIADPALRPHVPILNTLALANYGVPENVFNQARLVRRRVRYGVADVICCTSEAASQRAVALQQRFILVTK